MISWLLYKIFSAYIYSNIVFLFMSVFAKKLKKQRQSFLNISNAIIIVLLFLSLANEVYIAIECNASQTKTLGYSFNCYANLIRTILLAFLFQLLFLKKKFRVKVWATIASILLLIIFLNIDKLVVLYTSLFRDYMPSAWSVYYDTLPDTILTIAFSVFYFVVCLFAERLRIKGKSLQH